MVPHGGELFFVFDIKLGITEFKMKFSETLSENVVRLWNSIGTNNELTVLYKDEFKSSNYSILTEFDWDNYSTTTNGGFLILIGTDDADALPHHIPHMAKNFRNVWRNSSRNPCDLWDTVSVETKENICRNKKYLKGDGTTVADADETLNQFIFGANTSNNTASSAYMLTFFIVCESLFCFGMSLVWAELAVMDSSKTITN